MKKCIFAILLCISCSPSSAQDFRMDGERQTKELVRELRSVRTYGELQAAVPKLRKRFDALADLMLQAREFLLRQPEGVFFGPSSASDELFAELARLYELPGGKELIESAQAEALARLIPQRETFRKF